MEERPGPVLLELPEDIAGAKKQKTSPECRSIRSKFRSRIGLRWTVPPSIILKAKRPLIMLGVDSSWLRSTAGIGGVVFAARKFRSLRAQMGKGTVPGEETRYGNGCAQRTRFHVMRLSTAPT